MPSPRLALVSLSYNTKHAALVSGLNFILFIGPLVVILNCSIVLLIASLFLSSYLTYNANFSFIALSVLAIPLVTSYNEFTILL